MEFMWLYSLCQCVLSVCVMVASVRLCMTSSGTGGSVVAVDSRPPHGGGGSVSSCLRLCLGWVGAVGGAVGVPVSVLLNLRSPQCLYTCITLVCAPLLVRQFTMCLLLLLTLDAHLQRRLAQRYSWLVTRRRALCVVLLCWVGSVLSSFAQFIGSNVLDSRSAGSEWQLDGNWTNSSDPSRLPPPASKYPHHGFKVIGQYLPYGGFLSKFYVEDLSNFTYAEIHGSHWAVCAPDTILSPRFQVYVYGVTAFLLPFLGLLAIYLDLMCVVPRQSTSPFAPVVEPPKHESCAQARRSLALSLSLLVLLCLPRHITHILLLFAPAGTARPPVWAHQVASFLCQVYSLVPQLLSTPTKQRAEGGEEQAASCRGKTVGRALCEAAVHAAPWCSPANHSLKAKVCPEV